MMAWIHVKCQANFSGTITFPFIHSQDRAHLQRGVMIGQRRRHLQNEDSQKVQNYCVRMWVEQIRQKHVVKWTGKKVRGKSLMFVVICHNIITSLYKCSILRFCSSSAFEQVQVPRYSLICQKRRQFQKDPVLLQMGFWHENHDYDICGVILKCNNLKLCREGKREIKRKRQEARLRYGYRCMKCCREIVW